MNTKKLTVSLAPHPRTFFAGLSISFGCAPVEMWLVGEVGVGTMLGDEVFERVHNEVGVDAQYASPSCPSLVEAVGNQSIIKISPMKFSCRRVCGACRSSW